MRSKTGKKNVTKTIRQRARYRCPGSLKMLIEWVNSVPPDRKLPHEKELEAVAEGDEDRLLEMMKEKLAGVPQDFYLYSQVRGKTHPYMDFRRLRKNVHEIAQQAKIPAGSRPLYLLAAEARPEFERFLGDDPWNETSQYDDKTTIFPTFETFLTIDEMSGTIKAIPDEMMSALIGVPADRIRECVVCQRIFWARQNNMVACTSKCSDNNRQRLLRERKGQYAGSAKKKRLKSK